MCTVSLIPLPPLDGPAATRGLRLVCNRDEQRTRPNATPPRWRDLAPTSTRTNSLSEPEAQARASDWTNPPSEHEAQVSAWTHAPQPKTTFRAIWPADAQAGGTWIAANDQGLALCLLNLNPATPPPLPPPNQLVSRGKIIPRLIARHTPGDALAALHTLDLDRFAPFRLLAASPAPSASHILEVAWDRTDLRITRHHAAPLCLASSGLGDHLVQSRLPLFDGMVLAAGATPESQDLFHHHTWPDRPELSVMMFRAEARTVSVTTLEILPNPNGTHEPHDAHAFDVRMRYSPVLTRASADEQGRKAAMP